ncbi:MAG: glutamine--fructose-6-phosphate transaminase (isomerizing) [bacterium]|nr:glutamine--fructose-6-phosphate transaminase (isomerizing) [bacterium]
MCGIVGYVGKKNALPILLEGIKHLEYRGYDSSGLVIGVHSNLKNTDIFFDKSVGKVSNLEAKVKKSIRPKLNKITKFNSQIGICHSRWATHGIPSEENAHPHFDCNKEIYIVHNGIIENYAVLKAELIKSGHKFSSETDSEVIAHLIEEEKKKLKGRVRIEKAVKNALQKIKGTYGLAIFDVNEPEKLIAARNFSPLLIGIGKGEYFLASDATAILKRTRKVVYLEDNDLAVLTPRGYKIVGLFKRASKRTPQIIDWNMEKMKKGEFAHFMLKEIYEQPESISDSIRGRIDYKNNKPVLGGLQLIKKDLKNIKRVIISGMGTAYYAGLLTKDYIEELAKISAVAEPASEFHHRKQIYSKDSDLFLCFSQSGETADTLSALCDAKSHGVLSLGIVNVVGSSISRTTDAGVYQHIGPEIGVASTKAFTSQVVIGALLAVLLGLEHKTLFSHEAKSILDEIKKLPLKIGKILEDSDKIKQVANNFQKYNNFLFLGRKYNFPTALEGALKLKEVSYVHAEGMSSGEMKHGPIAMIDSTFPCIMIIPKDSVYEKNISNAEEIKARSGPIIAIATEGDNTINKISNETIFIPKTLEIFTPILATVVLQLFAYHFAVARGCDVDKPRNLAKSVTVE